MINCRICGNDFNPEKAEKLDCNCGCGSNLVLCPNCGYAIKTAAKKENKSLLKRLTDTFRMGY